MLPIPIYIGISKRFDVVKGLTKYSIERNTSAPVNIVHLYPDIEEGCTGFSNVRYTIERGIYLDCDMIVLGDIAELWGYRRPGKFVCLKDGSTEVAVIDCLHYCRNKHQQNLLPKEPIIPLNWNCEDKVSPAAKLVHFTDLKTQPWFFQHPNKEASALYEQYKTAYANDGNGVR